MKHLKALSALALAFVLLLFLTTAAIAQTAITVSGQLTNGLGAPLPGQQIGLVGPTSAGATTDANGRYAISVPAGNYAIQIGQFIHQTEHYDTSLHIPPYYRLQSSSFDLVQSTTLNLQIPFRKLSVHVQDLQGTAAANVFVNVDGGNTSNLAIASLPTGPLLAGGNSYFEGSFNGIVTNTNGDVDYWLLPTSTDPSACGGSGCGYSVTAQPQAGSQLALTSLTNVALTLDSSVTITLQSGVSLAGQVTDGHGNPLPGLLMMLWGHDPTTGGGLFTDANGRYGFSVSPNWYSLKIDHNRELIIPGDPWSFQLTAYDMTTGPMFQVTQNMTLDLPLPFRSLDVHVVDMNGRPVAGAGVAGNGGFSGVAIGGLTFNADSLYWYNPATGQVLRTNANGDATLLLFSSGYGNTITVYPAGLPPVSCPIPGTGDVNLTLRLDCTIVADVPTLASLSPASAEAGGSDFTLVVNGSGFVPSSVVMWNGAGRSTTFVSSTQLAASIPSTDIISAGSASLTVSTPAPGGGESNALPFTINSGPPVSLSGRITDADGTGLPNQSITLYGPISPSSFLEMTPGSTDGNGHYAFTVSTGYYMMRVDGGVPADSTLHAPQSYFFGSDSQFSVTQNMTLDFALPSQRTNVHAVDANDQPIAGAGLNALGPMLYGLTFSGVGFGGSSRYLYDTSTGAGVKTDANGNATLWLFPASDPAGGGYTIEAYPPAETGLLPVSLNEVIVTGETNVTLRFDGVLPAKVPVLGSISPASVAATSPSFTLVVTGTDFVKSSVVRWNGADRTTGFVSSTQLTATIPSTDVAAPGTANVTVWTPAPGGGESSALPFTIYTSVPSATINVYAALHATGSGSTSEDKKTPLALSLKVFDRATFPSAGLKDYASVWNSGPGVISPWARITGPTVTTFSNGPANLYTVRVPATGSANNVTSGRYLVVGKVDGAETYVGAVTDPLAVDSVTDEYLLVDQKPGGQISPAAVTSGTATPTPKATQTPKPKPTSKGVPTSPTPKPTGTPRPTATPKPTVTPKKVPSVPPNAVPTQEPAHATPTPKKPLTATPMATWTMLPTKTPQLTPTPRDKPTKH